MSGRVLIDTGPIVAILSEQDQHHSICVDALRGIHPPMLTCWPVLTEAAWLLRRRPADVQRLLAAFDRKLFELLPIGPDALPAIGAVLRKYERLEPQIADACLLHLAEREKIQTVFTLDRRDFEVFRLPGKRRLRLIPEL